MELGSKWFADLGPPFGVMYCIKCECVAVRISRLHPVIICSRILGNKKLFYTSNVLQVQKKRRVVAKVHCRNIKNECPEPSCDTPVLLPGRCCKTCPGDLNCKSLLFFVTIFIQPCLCLADKRSARDSPLIIYTKQVLEVIWCFF